MPYFLHSEQGLLVASKRKNPVILRPSELPLERHSFCLQVDYQVKVVHNTVARSIAPMSN